MICDKNPAVSRARGWVSHRVWNSVQTYFCMRIYCKINIFSVRFWNMSLVDLLKCWVGALNGSSLCFCRHTFFDQSVALLLLRHHKVHFIPSTLCFGTSWETFTRMHVQVRVGTALLGRWESGNAGKPVIMNLHVLTVAHYCRLFANECIFIRSNCSGVVRGMLSWCFYTCWVRKRGFWNLWNIVVGLA